MYLFQISKETAKFKFDRPCNKPTISAAGNSSSSCGCTQTRRVSRLVNNSDCITEASNLHTYFIGVMYRLRCTLKPKNKTGEDIDCISSLQIARRFYIEVANFLARIFNPWFGDRC